MKIPKSTPRDCNSHALLDRKKCFSVVATAVKGAVSDSVVDLKSPEVHSTQIFLQNVNIYFLYLVTVLLLLTYCNKLISFLYLLSCYRFLGYQMGRWWQLSQFFPKILLLLSHVSALRHCFLTPKWGIERVSSSCISRNYLHSMTSGFLLDFQKEMLMQNGTAKLIMGGMISSMR